MLSKLSHCTVQELTRFGLLNPRGGLFGFRDLASARQVASALRAAPDYADAMFNLALLLQRGNKHGEAAEYWRRYLANDAQSEWAARARRSLEFCEMQIHLSAASVQP
jgi:hypothetical protein